MDKIALVRLVAMQRIIAQIHEYWNDARLTATAYSWVSRYQHKSMEAAKEDKEYWAATAGVDNDYVKKSMKSKQQWIARNFFDKLCLMRDKGGDIADLFASMPVYEWKY